MPEEKDKKSISSGTNSIPGEETRVKVLFPDDELSDAQEVSKGVSLKVLSFNEKLKEEKVTTRVLFDSSFGENNTFKPSSNRPVTKIVLKNAEIRKQIRVSIDELREMSNVDDESVLRQTMAIVRSFNLDDGRDQKFTEFGTDLQEKYASKVKEIFKLTTNNNSDSAKTKLDHIAELIGKIDCACLVDSKKKFLFFFTSTKSEGELRQELDNAYAEIKKLASESEESLPELINTKNVFDEFARQIPGLLDEIEAVLLAGRFLVNYAGKMLSDFSLEDLEDKLNRTKMGTALHVFERRMESIELTKLSLLQGFDQVKMFRISILSMCNLIQDTMMTMIPLWHNSYLNTIVVLSSKKSKNKKSVYEEFKTIREQILTKLNGE